MVYHAVHVGRHALQPWMAQSSDEIVAMVVGQDEDDVTLAGLRLGLEGGDSQGSILKKSAARHNEPNCSMARSIKAGRIGFVLQTAVLVCAA